MFLLPLTNRGTDGDGGEYAPSLLTISYLGSLGPKALRELRFFKRFFICEDREALDSLLALYMPLINRLSSYAGNLDEDCRQYIMLHIVLHISEFKI